MEANAREMIKTYAAHFKVDPMAIIRRLRKLKITRKKKTLLYKKRDEEKLPTFLKAIENVPATLLVDVA